MHLYQLDGGTHSSPGHVVRFLEDDGIRHKIDLRFAITVKDVNVRGRMVVRVDHDPEPIDPMNGHHERTITERDGFLTEIGGHSRQFNPRGIL